MRRSERNRFIRSESIIITHPHQPRARKFMIKNEFNERKEITKNRNIITEYPSRNPRKERKRILQKILLLFN